MKEKFPELQDTEIAERLFGSVITPERTGRNKPNPDILRSPLPEGESAYVFCTSCDTHTPITALGATVLANRSEAPATPDWSNHYIQVEGCLWCNDAFAGAEILPIP